MLNARSADELRATAEEFSQDLQVQHSGGQVEWYDADLSDPEQVIGLIDACEDQLGPVDILVSNTGGPPAGRFGDLNNDQQWLDAYNLLVMAPVRLCRGVIPGMAERGWGRIIFITSTSIKQPILHLALSSIVRPAVAGLSKTLALEYADRGITSNVVLPGPYDTERSVETLRLQSEATGESIPELMKKRAASIPVKRSGDPMELGAVVAFLASQQAAYTTGTVLWVDGGTVQTTL